MRNSRLNKKKKKHNKRIKEYEIINCVCPYFRGSPLECDNFTNYVFIMIVSTARPSAHKTEQIHFVSSSSRLRVKEKKLKKC